MDIDGWLEKFDVRLIEAKKNNEKFFIVDAPKDTFFKKLFVNIIVDRMNLKLTGEKTNRWKIVLTGKKKKKPKATVVKLK